MTPATNAALRDLEKRLNEATCADREIENAIFDLIDQAVHEPGVVAPVYTRSIDCAVALCERVLWGRGLLIGRGRTRPDEPLWGVQILASDENEERREMPVLAEAEANTPALALCLAIVRALLSQAPQ